MTPLTRFLAELSGVAVIAIGAALWWLPLFFVVIGVYLIMIGNSSTSGTSGMDRGGGE